MNPSMNPSMNDSMNISWSVMDNSLANSSLEGSCIDLPSSIPALEYSVGGNDQMTEAMPSSTLYYSSPNSSLDTSLNSSINNTSIYSPSTSLHQSTYTTHTSPQTSPSSHALDPPTELTSSRLYAGKTTTSVPAIMRKRSIAEPIPLVPIPLPPPMEEVDPTAPVIVIYPQDEN